MTQLKNQMPLRLVVVRADRPLGIAGAQEGLECGHWHINSMGWSFARRRRCRKCWRGMPVEFNVEECRDD